jgi:hypothetical protein
MEEGGSSNVRRQGGKSRDGNAGADTYGVLWGRGGGE